MERLDFNLFFRWGSWALAWTMWCGSTRPSRRIAILVVGDRVVDVVEELMKFILLTRDISGYLLDRCSERKEEAAKLEARVNLQSV
jgi:hypothetical protein